MWVTDEAEETSTSGSSAAAVPADAAVRVLVFVVYKKEATHVANGLCEQGFAAEALQGDMSQRKRCAS
jgi:superfamily II DNA/RNA helicase